MKFVLWLGIILFVFGILTINGHLIGLGLLVLFFSIFFIEPKKKKNQNSK